MSAHRNDSSMRPLSDRREATSARLSSTLSSRGLRIVRVVRIVPHLRNHMCHHVLHGSAFPYGGRSRAETEPECPPGAREEGAGADRHRTGQAVAELRPLPSPTDALGRLVDEGRVVPARRLPSALPRPLLAPFTGASRPDPWLHASARRGWHRESIDQAPGCRIGR